MALIRCSSCGVKPPGHGGYKRNYVTSVNPLGHPKSALICGTPSCAGSGLIWLEKSESNAYEKGDRIFGLQTNTTKVRAQ
jgi:hypothetical protein